MKEYSRSLYVDRVNKGLEEQDKYALATLESFYKNSPKLKSKAVSAMSRLDKKLPKVFRNLANATYIFLIKLAEATLENTREMNKFDKFVNSVYDNTALKRASSDLDKASKAFLNLPDFETPQTLK